MDTAFEYYIPFAHPLIVHFPIVLLLLAAATVTVWMVRDREVWLRASAGLFWLGSLGVWFASRTGEVLADESRGAPMVEALIELHEAAADWTLYLAFALSVVVTALLAFESRWWPQRPGSPRMVRLVVWLMAMASAGCLVWTAHLGGLMVWGVPV